MFLAQRRERQELAVRLEIETLAARGEGKAVTKAARELRKDRGPGQ